MIRGTRSVIREEGELKKAEASATTARTKIGTMLLMPPRVNTQRVGKRLKKKGICFALVHPSRIGVKKSEPFAAPFGAQGKRGKKE